MMSSTKTDRHTDRQIDAVSLTSRTIISGGMHPDDSTVKMKWSATLFNCTLSLHPSFLMHSLTVQYGRVE
jgi:hypothetical protein